MDNPVVDVVVAVHTPTRPVQRAVASILVGTQEDIRVTVVCHNVEPDVISANLGPYSDDPRVRLLSLQDGVPSPAGPFNLGLDAATAPFTAMLDSDDTLEPGAIDSWLARARVDNADVVIQRLTSADGKSTRTPPVRWGRSSGLDGVRDRLAYRTRQHGLVSRERFPDVRLTVGLRTGEDVEQGMRLWYSGAAISFDRKGPAYVIHEDGGDRTSVSTKPVAEDFSFLDAVINAQWSETLTAAARESIAIKLLRTHVMDALTSRYLRQDQPPTPDESDALSEVARRIVDFAPTSVHIVSRRDNRIIRELLCGTPNPLLLRQELAVRKDYRRLGNIVSAAVIKSFHREAPLRFLAALAVTP